MVARTPPKLRKTVAPLNPVLVRETLLKVDRCMARLQELQYTVTGGRKVVGGVSLSPRSTRVYIKTSVRCKQQSIRNKNSSLSRSPVGKFPSTPDGEWRRMSLPAMLVGETVGEILQASKFAREILDTVAAAAGKSNNRRPSSPTSLDDPRTPISHTSNCKPPHHPENSKLKTRRKREKQNIKARLDSKSPSLQRARSRINFKVSPPKQRECEKENNRYTANRVSPRNRPWAKKTVLFPNPIFTSTQSTQPQKFCKTRSPVLAKKSVETPHKFLIKSPHAASKFLVKTESPPRVCISPTRALPKFQVKIKSPPRVCISQTRTTSVSKKSPRASTASKLRRSLSPARLANRLMSMSPLKSRKSVQKSSDGLMSGLKQRPAVLTPIRLYSRSRIQVTG